MKFKSKIIVSSLCASGMLIASFLFPFIPCKKFPNVPNPSVSYSACTLNPDIANSYDSIVHYFGYTPQLTTAYFIVLFSTFFVSFGVLSFLSRKHK